MDGQQKYLDVKRLTGEAFWVAFGMALSILAGFAGVRLLTGVMVPEEYGKLGLAMSISMALQYSLAVAMNTSAARFYAVAKENGVLQWYWRLLSKTSIRIFLLTVTLSIFGFFILRIFSEKDTALVFSLSLLLGGLIVICGIGTGIQSGARNRKAICWSQNLFNWGRFLFAFILIVLFSGTATHALVGFIFAALLMIASQYYYVRKEVFPLIRSEQHALFDRTPDFFSYLRPLLISGACIWVQLFSVRWVLNLFGSLVDVGGYFAYHQIGFMPMLTGGYFLMRFLAPIFFDHASDRSNEKAQLQLCVINGRISFGMFILVVFGFLLVMWLTPFLARILVSPTYRNDAWMLPWLVLSGGLYSVSSQLLLSVYSGVESGRMIPISVLGGGLSFVLNIVGGVLGGIPGIIYSGVCFSAIYLILAWRLHWKVYSENILLRELKTNTHEKIY